MCTTDLRIFLWTDSDKISTLQETPSYGIVGVSLRLPGLGVLCRGNVHLKCFRCCQVAALKNAGTKSHHPPAPYEAASVSTFSINDQFKNYFLLCFPRPTQPRSPCTPFPTDAAARGLRCVPVVSPSFPSTLPSTVLQAGLGSPSAVSWGAPVSLSCLTVCLEASTGPQRFI